MWSLRTTLFRWRLRPPPRSRRSNNLSMQGFVAHGPDIQTGLRSQTTDRCQLAPSQFARALLHFGIIYLCQVSGYPPHYRSNRRRPRVRRASATIAQLRLSPYRPPSEIVSALSPPSLSPYIAVVRRWNSIIFITTTPMLFRMSHHVVGGGTCSRVLHALNL